LHATTPWRPIRDGDDLGCAPAPAIERLALEAKNSCCCASAIGNPASFCASRLARVMGIGGPSGRSRGTWISGTISTQRATGNS
jgi:hypothetical protein